MTGRLSGVWDVWATGDHNNVWFGVIVEVDIDTYQSHVVII